MKLISLNNPCSVSFARSAAVCLQSIRWSDVHVWIDLCGVASDTAGKSEDTEVCWKGRSFMISRTAKTKTAVIFILDLRK